MLIPQELQLSPLSQLKKTNARLNVKTAQFENLGELVKNTIFVA